MAGNIETDYLLGTVQRDDQGGSRHKENNPCHTSPHPQHQRNPWRNSKPPSTGINCSTVTTKLKCSPCPDQANTNLPERKVCQYSSTNNIYLSIYLPIQEVLLSTKDWELFVKARGKKQHSENTKKLSEPSFNERF